MERTQVRRRTSKATGNGKVGYGENKNTAAKTKEFNKEAVYVQGFRATLVSAGTQPVTIALNSPGKFLLGISVMPASGTNSDISNSQTTLIVNNNNLLQAVGTSNLNPASVNCNQFFTPTPQPLAGNDNIIVNILNNASTTPVVYINVFYIPQ